MSNEEINDIRIKDTEYELRVKYLNARLKDENKN